MTDTNDKTDLCEMAYTMGYERFEHSSVEWKEMLQTSENPTELWSNGGENQDPINDLARESRGKENYQRMVRDVKHEIFFGPENEDRNSVKIYGIIKDCQNSWKNGVFDALMGKEFNPEE